MIKYIMLITASLWVTICMADDEQYYKVHPHVLEQALKACPKPPSTHMSCEQLATIASQVNVSADQLRSDPQGYGKKILSLQEAIAKQESILRTTPLKTDLQSSLNENKRILQARLAIVKWLESPEG